MKKVLKQIEMVPFSLFNNRKSLLFASGFQVRQILQIEGFDQYSRGQDLTEINSVSPMSQAHSKVMITVWTDIHQVSVPAAEVEHYQRAIKHFGTVRT